MTVTQPRRRAARTQVPLPLPAPPIDPAADTAPEQVDPAVDKDTRGPLDPITRPLWRMRRPDRCRIMEPFLDRQIKIERWYGRVAGGGDITYRGTLVAIATTTIGSAADLLILKTTDGNVWAISTAQVAYVQHIGKERRDHKTATQPAEVFDTRAATETEEQ